MRRLALACVVVLVTLAGCSAFVGGEGGADTVTPAPVPTTATPSPPGVTADRIDVATLVAAHARVLAETSYTLRVDRRITRGNETVSTFERTRRVAAGGERYAGRYGRSATNPVGSLSTVTVEYWTGGDGYAARHIVRNATVYRGWQSTGDPIRDVDRSRRLNRTLSAVPLRVAGRTDEAVVLVGRDPGPVDGLPTPPLVGGERNATVSARVTHAGVVTDLRFAYDARVGDGPVRVVYTVAVTDVGSTTVDRPAWVDRARNESGP